MSVCTHVCTHFYTHVCTHFYTHVYTQEALRKRTEANGKLWVKKVEELEKQGKAEVGAVVQKLELQTSRATELMEQITELQGALHSEAERTAQFQRSADEAHAKLRAELQEEAALKTRAEQNGKLWADRVEELDKQVSRFAELIKPCQN